MKMKMMTAVIESCLFLNKLAETKVSVSDDVIL